MEKRHPAGSGRRGAGPKDTGIAIGVAVATLTLTLLLTPWPCRARDGEQIAASSVAGGVEVDVGVDVLYAADGTRILWTSVDHALDGEGEIRWELFSPFFVDTYRRTAEATADALARGESGESCSYSVCRLGQKPHGSLDDMVEHATAIVGGRVVAAEVGLDYQGSPATLIRVRPGVVPRPGDLRLDGDDLLALIPAGVAELVGVRLCAGNSYGIEKMPRPGDDVLLLPYGAPADGEDRVIHVRGEELMLFPTAAGAVIAPGLVDRDEIEARGSLAGVVELVKAKLADPLVER